MIKREVLEDTWIVSFERPEFRNALSTPLLTKLVELFSDVPDSVAAIVLTGSGSHFSAGADLHEMTGTGEDLTVDRAIGDAAQAIRTVDVPVIAAVEGACFGAAVELLLACDVRVASETAFFGIPAAKLGILYRPAAIARYHRILVGDALSRLLLAGEVLDSASAQRGGLISTLVPAGKAANYAITLAERIADNHREAVKHSKQLLRELDGGEYRPAYWESVRQELASTDWRRAALRDFQSRASDNG